jgi:acetyl-CoA/propionyl-CoA carboxylase biotin carboxyl carrier protein
VKTVFKVAGRKLGLSERDQERVSSNGWAFETRPGGWMIARRTGENGLEQRIRFRYSRKRGAFFAKVAAPHAMDFFGERTQVSAAAHSASAASDYTAQFPGKVRKVSVMEGAEVQAGAPLLMVEAMKMEFAIKAGTKGRVIKFLVQEGMQLSPGQQLLLFEETP